jgi:hypothetical protein
MSVDSFSSATLNERMSLLGIEEVCLEVDDVQFFFRNHYVANGDIREDIKLRFEEAGMSILSEQECSRNGQKPYLHFEINILEIERESYVGTIRLDLYQWVTLMRSSGIETIASTWSHNWIGPVDPSDLEEIRSIVLDIAGTFINDHLAGNGFWMAGKNQAGRSTSSSAHRKSIRNDRPAYQENPDRAFIEKED